MQLIQRSVSMWGRGTHDDAMMDVVVEKDI